jgi:16S rRNA (adenine1518-N6/adenine1519-N6)-dimethyltransferase
MNLSSPSTVRALLSRHSLFPRRRFGQNFLVDTGTLTKIVDAGGVTEGAQVLEIGAGLGVLTRALATAVTPAGRVVTVEVDRALLPILTETVGDFPQVRVICADALSLAWPAFLDQNFGTGAVLVVANIPYNITSPLIASLLEHKGRFSQLVFLVQKEVASRIAATADTGDYGAFSVFVQYHAAVDIVATVGRRVFYPPPDVDSAIIRLIPHARPLVDVRDEKLFFAIVRAAFGQRRKVLVNALQGDPALGWDRAEAAQALDAAGIDPSRRGETLTIAEFAAIANAGHSRM